MQNIALAAHDVSVEFSGLRALNGVSLSLTQGEILGLIGPNGSGKTTLVNAITGQVPLAGGRITLGEADITGRLPRQVALAGVARSFQIVRLFENLTVLENVATPPLSQGIGRSEARHLANDLLAEFGLSARADDLAMALNYGDKRRVEIARTMAANPLFLLLDEPAAGMNEGETTALLDILSGLPAARKLGLLIIDHDMGLIMRLCQRLHVLAFGRTIAEGDRLSVRNDPAVIEAYLGKEAVNA